MTHALIETLSKLERARQSLDGPLQDAIAQSVDQNSIRLVDQQPHAAVLIAVRGGFQEPWSRREEMSTALYEKLDAVGARARNDRVPANYRELDRTQPMELSTCTNCRIRPGFGPCPRCSGVGVLLLQPPGSDNSQVQDCPECEDGFATCTVCGGSKESVRATIRYVNFKPFDTNHIVGGNFRDALVAAFPLPAMPPDELAYDVEGSGTETAYRGQQAIVDRVFHGHPFGDAVQQARAFVRRVQAAPNFVLHELRTFALPLVVATYASASRTHVVALFIDAKGNPRFGVLQP